MQAAQLAVRIAELIIFGALALIAVKRWRQHHDTAALWWAATVGILASVVAASFLISTTSESNAASWERKVLLALLLLFPYCLFRYGGQFVHQYVSLRRVAQFLTGGVVVWTFFLPRLGGSDAPRTTAIKFYLVGILVQWTLLSCIATYRLWRIGAKQASVARSRMRTMAVGTALLNIALLFAAFVPGDTKSGWPVVTGLMAIVCALCFFVGFVPPRVLRVVWRSPDAIRLRQAEISLMAVIQPEQIGAALVPHVAALFGGQGGVLVAPDGTVLAAAGLDPTEAKAAAVLATRATAENPVVQEGLIAVCLRNGWLAVRGSQLSPFFGRDEVDLLVGLGVFADLALERARLFQAERVAREEAERANDELETFVYSVSHDLKSPLVSLLGFLDYLKADVDESLSDEGRFFLDRISAASLYMQALIQDLLELSRIGRVQTESTDVDLAEVVHEVVAEQEAVHPNAALHIGALPVVTMNGLRARQLFTNLVANAIVHSGRDDVIVKVDAAVSPTGDVVVSVADNGKGVPADYREKIFGVFERLERQDSNSPNKGTGIGLAVCRKILEQYGGEITVADNGPGARFDMRFPAVAVRRGPAQLEAAK
ncbi:MAG: hypothetical protein QOK43_2462 [Acidimicrobiaceae bacterium]|jgi:signal transduction histidine kinase|nr:hypothetical protein [Acidimicrobiaceae bacterium]MDQ1445426.1 hypothetical protein [Acidimicrobiaceae bacterium]